MCMALYLRQAACTSVSFPPNLYILPGVCWLCMWRCKWLLTLSLTLLQTGFFNDQIGPVVVAVLIVSSLIFIASMAFHDMLTR